MRRGADLATSERGRALPSAVSVLALALQAAAMSGHPRVLYSALHVLLTDRFTPTPATVNILYLKLSMFKLPCGFSLLAGTHRVYGVVNKD